MQAAKEVYLVLSRIVFLNLANKVLRMHYYEDLLNFLAESMRQTTGIKLDTAYKAFSSDLGTKLKKDAREGTLCLT